MEYAKTGVVGAGTMGHGIAQVLAISGRRVRLVDVDPNALGRAHEAISRSLGKLVEKGKLPADSLDAALARLKVASSVEELSDRDLVVEVIVEQEAAKRDLLKELDSACQPQTILASNTSSISITRLAAATPSITQ